MGQIKNIKWGFIGCGSVTEIKSGPAYQQIKGFEVYGVTRRSKLKAIDYAKRHNIPQVFENADDLINSKNIDAVYIATPPDSHLYYALKVANAGKPCCIEKPMAPNHKESLKIFNAFHSKSIPLFIAYYRRSLPRFNKVRELLEEEAIGKVRHVRWYLSKPPNQLDLNREPNWRTDARVAPGGYFDDLASHGLDLFMYLLGDVKEACGFATNQLGLYSAKDAIVGNWIHQSGVTGEGSWNFGSFKREDKVEIIGSNGNITFSVFDEAPIIQENTNEVQEFNISNPKHIQEYHVLNIQNHLTGKLTHPSLGKTGLHTSWVMDKILGVL
ncbi:Gfo/Idh/MocA family protein [Maribacter sp. HTCC2170]|uniref:Gfo/Idh/MocA family protein n=1 Tax=Maribacter sp. (strain HTCC2170 / KCCM 42371) TaxID=313603 RepID=UPI00032122F5|nr:Gfo/Idh/MocA family oxidoreductase [Maribacter sp. HTCC2170]